MQTVVMTITPQQAALWLTKNTINRPIKSHVVEHYAEIMSSGGWRLNGETIIFGPDGTLIDGQHRLLACERSQVAFTALVVFGIETEVFSTIDRGAVRLTSDILALRGEKNAKRLDAALTLLENYQTGRLVGLRRYKVEPERVMALLELHPAMREAAQIAGALPVGLKTASTAFAAYAGLRVDEKMAGSFLEKLRTGTNLSQGDPALALRNRMIVSTVPLPVGQGRAIAVVSLTLKALNAHFTGRSISTLRWAGNEGIPDVCGFRYGQTFPSQVKEVCVPR